MRVARSLTALGILLVLAQMPLPSEARAVSPDPQTVLARADSVINAPADQIQDMELILIEKNGAERIRRIRMWQKGDDTRTVKFLEPADVRNIGFLSLPDDVMYLYMPAFKKVRRIASHVKNQSFAGTDFTYDDMGTIKYADDYDAKLAEETPECFVLLLSPRPEVEKDYAQLKMWITKDTFYPTKTEYYDRGGNLCKIMERREVSQIQGYWTAAEVEMHDLKAQHRTRMRLSNVEFDSGLSDDMFTARFLQRRL